MCWIKNLCSEWDDELCPAGYHVGNYTDCYKPKKPCPRCAEREWISVETLLPTYDGMFLCYVEHEIEKAYQDVRYYSHVTGFSRQRLGEKFVTSWKPLDEPPK